MEDDILYDIKRYSVWTNETDLNKVILMQFLKTAKSKNLYYNFKGHQRSNKTKKFAEKLL